MQAPSSLDPSADLAERLQSSIEMPGTDEVRDSAMECLPAGPKLAQLVADRIRAQIIRHELHPGDNLPFETEMTAAYGVSRPIIREALRILETEQLIKLQRGGRAGAVVLTPSLGASAQMFGTLLQYERVNVGDVWKARSDICCSAVGQLSRDSAGLDFAELKQRMMDLSGLVDAGENFRQAGLSIGDELVRLTGNSTALLMVRMLRHIVEAELRAFRHSFDADASEELSNYRASCLEDGLRALELIEEGRPEAEQIWRSTQDKLGRVLINAIGHMTIIDVLAVSYNSPMQPLGLSL